MKGNVALLNGPQKDEMAQDIRNALQATLDTAEMNLLTHQFATYHEYAAAFAVAQTARAQREQINKLIKKHLED